jgi:hypothetical protein
MLGQLVEFVHDFLAHGDNGCMVNDGVISVEGLD